MFSNIGGKIKVLTVVGMILGIIGFVIFGGSMILISIFGDAVFEFFYSLGIVLPFLAFDSSIFGIIFGAVIIVCGCFGMWLASFIPYGLGHLIQNSDRIAKNLDTLKQIEIQKLKDAQMKEHQNTVIAQMQNRAQTAEETFLHKAAPDCESAKNDTPIIREQPAAEASDAKKEPATDPDITKKTTSEPSVRSQTE